MKKIILLLPLFFAGCTVNQKIAYNLNDVTLPQETKPIAATVEVRILKDNRMNWEENSVLFNQGPQTKINGKQLCINAEKHYKKDSVVNQITKLIVEHFNKSQLFQQTYYNQNSNAKYYLTGTLNSFYSEEEFSSGVAIGSSFGLLGALATSGIKTPGRVVIEISDLKLFSKDGTLIKDFGNFYKEYKENFRPDASCWCAYWNANEMLKDFNTHLVEKIRNEMLNVKL